MGMRLVDARRENGRTGSEAREWGKDGRGFGGGADGVLLVVFEVEAMEEMVVSFC